MDIEKMVLYILSHNQGLNTAETKEIIKSISKNSNGEAEKSIKKLIASKDISKKGEELTLLAKARRKMVKPCGKISDDKIKSRRWTMVLFDISERNKKIRDVLRYKLKNMGFGMMQGSVWVRPSDVVNDVRRFIRAKNLQWQVKVLSFEMATPDEKEIIHRIWKMEKLNDEYRRFVKKTINRFRRLKIYPFSQPKLLSIALDLLSKITEKDYLCLYAKDPKLPVNLIPSDWNGKRAHNIYRQLDKYLVR